MAKKAKEAAEDGAPVEAGAGGGKKKLMVIAGAAVAVLALGGGGAFMFLGGGKHGEAHADTSHGDAKAQVAFLDIREMTVNLAAERNGERVHTLKFKVALELKDAKVLAEVQPLVPRVEDALQVYVRELRSTDLEGSGGVFRLREELLRRVNAAVYPAKANAVLFKDMIVQ